MENALDIHYWEFNILASEEISEMLMALLGDSGCESFMEKPDGLLAYLPYTQDPQAYKQTIALLSDYQSKSLATFSVAGLERQNWNSEWEKNFEPVCIDNLCFIRAHFHPPNPAFDYQILITPKMSFGTGHHATTALMIVVVAGLNLEKAQVLDAGTGTGVLAIWAALRGAAHIVAFDNDAWAVLNAKENASLNHFENIEIFEGQIYDLPSSQTFDVILANINRNILLEQIGAYAALLNSGGHLVLSGFYPIDLEAIGQACTSAGLHTLKSHERQGWAALEAQKL